MEASDVQNWTTDDGLRLIILAALRKTLLVNIFFCINVLCL